MGNVLVWVLSGLADLIVKEMADPTVQSAIKKFFTDLVAKLGAPTIKGFMDLPPES